MPFCAFQDALVYSVRPDSEAPPVATHAMDDERHVIDDAMDDEQDATDDEQDAMDDEQDAMDD